MFLLVVGLEAVVGREDLLWNDEVHVSKLQRPEVCAKDLDSEGKLFRPRVGNSHLLFELVRQVLTQRHIYRDYKFSKEE